MTSEQSLALVGMAVITLGVMLGGVLAMIVHVVRKNRRRSRPWREPKPPITRRGRDCEPGGQCYYEPYSRPGYRAGQNGHKDQVQDLRDEDTIPY